MDAKELVKQINALCLTTEDVVNYGLMTPKAIGKTKKRWTCNDSGKTIEVGSPAIRSFRPNSHGGFDKLYWDVNALETIFRKELVPLSNINVQEVAFHEAIDHGQD